MICRFRFRSCGVAVCWLAASLSPAGAREVTTQHLVDAAQIVLREALEPRFSRVDLRAMDRVAALSVEEGVLSLVARPPAIGAVHRRMQVVVDVQINGRTVRTVPVWFHVRAHAERWTATTNLPAGHTLSADDMRRAEIDVTSQPAASGSAQLQGMRLRRSIRAGDVLYTSSVAPQIWVRRQAPVVLELRQAAVQLESRGIALADGHSGQWVGVRLSSSPRIVHGRVIAPGRVAYERAPT
jgi:flagella basal body P-ring formation protein FlgA